MQTLGLLALAYFVFGGSKTETTSTTSTAARQPAAQPPNNTAADVRAGIDLTREVLSGLRTIFGSTSTATVGSSGGIVEDGDK